MQCRADQKEIKLLLLKHHGVMGTELDNATSAMYNQTNAIYNQTDLLLRSVQGIRELFDYFYKALTELSSSATNESGQNKSKQGKEDADENDDSEEDTLDELIVIPDSAGLNKTDGNGDGRSAFKLPPEKDVEGVQ